MSREVLHIGGIAFGAGLFIGSLMFPFGLVLAVFVVIGVWAHIEFTDADEGAGDG